MSDEVINQKQILKEKFFQNESKLFSKKSKFISYTCKSSTDILSNIASKKQFKQIRQRYKVELLISKILLKSQYSWVLYAFYRKQTLYIATRNHIGQSELNLQKLTLLKYFKQSKDFSDIINVSVFRDNKFKEKKHLSKKDTIKIKERSYAIFTNNLSDKKHKHIVEQIRENIKRNISI